MWDAFSLLNTVMIGRPSRHLSANEERVSQLHAIWEEGDAVVDAVLTAPSVFAPTTNFKFVQQTCFLPGSVIKMVKALAGKHAISLENAWYATLMTMSLQCLKKGSGVFWIQSGNRDADNSAVCGYVTSEVGFFIDVDEEASLDTRLAQCLETLKAGNGDTNYRNVFREIAMAHPAYDDHLATSLMLILLGSEGPDETDRSLLFESIVAEQKAAGKPEGVSEAFYGNMNWIELGNEANNAIKFQGRDDVVDFCADVLLPTLTKLADSHGMEKDAVELAKKETTLTVEQRIQNSNDANDSIDAAVATESKMPERADFAVIGAGLAGLTVAALMSQQKEDFLVIEKTKSVGGQWRWNANALSRVNSSEPSYRLHYEGRKPKTNHSHCFEVMRDINDLVNMNKLNDKFHTSCEVRAVFAGGDGYNVIDGRHTVKDWNGAFPETLNGSKFQLRSLVTVLCTNRRLGVPRLLPLIDEDLYLNATFRSQVSSGLAFDADRLECEGRRVCVLGMGAFAVENIRTTLERKAAYVTVLCRQHGACAAQILDWLRFVRPFNEEIRTAPVGAIARHRTLSSHSHPTRLSSPTPPLPSGATHTGHPLGAQSGSCHCVIAPPRPVDPSEPPLTARRPLRHR